MESSAARTAGAFESAVKEYIDGAFDEPHFFQGRGVEGFNGRFPAGHTDDNTQYTRRDKDCREE